MTNDKSGDFSVLRLRLVTDENTARRLDTALGAAGRLQRALTRWGLTNLDQMRHTIRWHIACAMPTGLSASGEVTDPTARKARNAAFNDLRHEFHLTEYDFKKKVLELRRNSVWTVGHVPSQSALVHGASVWEAFAAHLFSGAGRPKIPRPWENRVLEGASRDEGRATATPAERERAEARAKNAPRAREGSWSGLSLRTDEGRVSVHLHPSRDKQRHVEIPTVTSSALSAREAWYLGDPDSWRRVKIVRREVRHHHIYEVHLLCAKPAYRDPARYADAPDAVVGVDLGVSTIAAVGIGVDDIVTDVLLIRPSMAELAQRQRRSQHLRRAQRAMERSRRATNPEAYGPDRHGRKGRGSRLASTRLVASKAYKKQRRALRDERRREVEARVITTNMVAASVVARCGKNIVTENVSVKAWQKTWGKSLSYFAPSELSAALKREALLAAGTFDLVPCQLGLTQSCHCGALKKKSLSQRWHHCTVCGSGYDSAPVDRDVHSAYLAAFVTRSSNTISSSAVTLDTGRALTAWSGAEAPLVAVSGDPRQRRTTQSHSRGALKWSRHNASDRAGREIASDVDLQCLERDQDVALDEVGVEKTHAVRLRYKQSTTETGRPDGRQLRLDG